MRIKHAKERRKIVMTKKLKEVSLLILLLLNISITGVINFSRDNFEAKAYSARATRIYIEPPSGTATVGATYTINVKVEDVINLVAFDIQFRWGATVLKYLSHTVKVPVETYPEGVLHAGFITLKNEVNETQVPNALPGTMGWFGYVSYGPAFNGSGTILTMDFEVLGVGECDIYFLRTQLADNEADPIPHQVEEGYFYMSGLGDVPVANFTVWPDPAVATKTVVFNASASNDSDGNIALYMWNFGDGNTTNTNDAIITHNYTSVGFYDVQLTVLDDQGDGSQSRVNYTTIQVVLPNPVAEFTFSPDIAVVNKTVSFDASASYDPDPGGKVVEYIWEFGDENETITIWPTITHCYNNTPLGGATSFTVNLTVVDLEGLPSNAYLKEVPVVERRDIEVTDVTVSPSELTRGDNVTINTTVANYGQVDESFNVTAYYNRTATEWVQIGEVTGEEKELLKQYIPAWEVASSNSSVNNLNWVLNEGSGATICSNNTRIKVGNHTGYWTLNPGRLNEEDASTTIVDSAAALTSGGWILEEAVGGPKIVNGDFYAGNWSFLVRLYATEHNVNATIFVRILKSNNANPQASGAEVTVLKDWTELFTVKSLSNTTKHYQGEITIPQITLTNEHLYFEYQLHVTGNLASNDTEVIFQTGVPPKSALPRAHVETTTFNYKKQYTFIYNTENVPPGSYAFMVNASQVPHDINPTNNVKYTSNVNVLPHLPAAKFTFTPATPLVYEQVLFDASETTIDRFLTAEYSWDFGDGTPIANTTDLTYTHIYTAEGNYTVTLTVTDSWNQTDFTTKQVRVKTEYTPLDLTVDVAKILFRGEVAEFSILVSRSGGRFNASEINAKLYFDGSVIETFSMQNVTYVDTGFYMIRYPIPISDTSAPSGTYTLVVDANYLIPEANLNLLGTNLVIFLLSSTLTGWDALLTGISNDTATIIIPSLREIKANLTLINATLVDIQGTVGIVNSILGTFTVELDNLNATISGLIVDVKGEILAKIDTTLGTITTRLNNLNTTVTDIKGDTANIDTNLGEVQTSVGGVHSMATIGLAAASILSAVAAAAAVLAVLLLRKLGE